MLNRHYVYVLEGTHEKTRVFESFEAAKAVFDDAVTWYKGNINLKVSFEYRDFIRFYEVYVDDKGDEFYIEKIELSITKLEVEG